MSTKDPQICKVAFIGAGYMASEHIKVFKSLDNVELVGIYSRTKQSSEKLAKDFSIQVVAQSINSLYELTKPDLVIIAVPILEVKGVCCEAFNLPWTILVEKPVGYNLTEALELTKIAHKKKAKVFVALNRRHYSGIGLAQEDLSTRDSERLIFIYDQQDRLTARLNGEPNLVVKNYMYANSIHMVDLFYLFGRGDVVNVENVVPWNPIESKYVVSKITFSSGDVGIYKAIWDAPGPWAITVSAADIYWEMRPVEKASFQVMGSRKLEEVAIDDCDFDYKPGLRLQAIQAINAVFNKPCSLPNISDATKSMELVASIYDLQGKT